MNPIGVAGFPFLGLLFGLYAAAAVTSYWLRAQGRWVSAAGAGSAALLTLWFWSLDLSRPIWLLPGGSSIDLEAPLQFAGYAIQLKTNNAPIVALCQLIAAAALLLNLQQSRPTPFPAQVWGLLGGYTALALFTAAPVPTILVAPILLSMLVAAAAALHSEPGGQAASQAGPLRSLLPPLLAAPFFLVGGWWIEQIPLDPQNLALTQTAGTLLGLGLLLLLAPFPLHGSWAATSESAPPTTTLLASLFYQLAVLHLVAQAVNTYPFVVRQTYWPLWIGILGLLTAAWGGIAALGTLQAGRLWGYAALHDWGLILFALSTPGLRSWTAVLFLFILRIISMATTAVGLNAIQQQAGTLTMWPLRSIGLRMPWNSAALLLGGLGLAGFPLTAGFAGHWAALQTLAQIDWRPSMAIVVASAGVVAGFIRLARLLFAMQEARLTAREGALSIGLAVTLLLLVLTAALAPQLLSPLITRTLAAFS